MIYFGTDVLVNTYPEKNKNKHSQATSLAWDDRPVRSFRPDGFSFESFNLESVANPRKHCSRQGIFRKKIVAKIEKTTPLKIRILS